MMGQAGSLSEWDGDGAGWVLLRRAGVPLSNRLRLAPGAGWVVRERCRTRHATGRDWVVRERCRTRHATGRGRRAGECGDSESKILRLQNQEYLTF